MNKKHFITIALVAVLFISGMLAFVIIPYHNSLFKPVSMPANTSTVSGNGGSAVMVDEYLYYVGNYVDISGLKYRDNDYNRVTDNYGAIYRIKLESGIPQYKDTARSIDPKGPFDPKDVELVVPKVAGFENASLYVFDKYLIYTSPNNMKDKKGNLQQNRTDFFRVELTGKDNTKLYTTENDSVAKSNWTVVSVGGNIYLLVVDGQKLVRVEVSGNAGKTEVVSERISGTVGLPVVSAYYNESENRNLAASYGGVMAYVYFTEEPDSEIDAQKYHQGNYLKRYYINGNSTSTLGGENKTVYGVVGLSGGHLMYTVGSTDNDSFKNTYITVEQQDDTCDGIMWSNRTDVGEIQHGDETIYMQTESSGTESADAECIFIGFSTAASSIYIYRESRGYNYSSNFETITNVSGVISLNASHLYYTTKDGYVQVVNFNYNKTNVVGQASTSDMVTQIKITTFSTLTSTGEMFFYLRTYTQGDNTTTIPVIVDCKWNPTEEEEYVSGKVYENKREPREYIIGYVDEDYLPELDD